MRPDADEPAVLATGQRVSFDDPAKVGTVIAVLDGTKNAPIVVQFAPGEIRRFDGYELSLVAW